MQVTYANVISPLADLDAELFPLVQSCVFPKLVSTSEDVRKASAEAERRIDAHVLSCRYHLFIPVLVYNTCFKQVGASTVERQVSKENRKKMVEKVMSFKVNINS